MDERAFKSRAHGPRWPWGTIAVGLLFGLLGFLGVASRSDAAGQTVGAINFTFVAPGGGSSLTIVVGGEVTWVASGDPHTVTSGSPGAIDDRFVDHPASVAFLFDGDRFTTTFPTSGTYPYFCEVHPEQMRGTVIVVAGATTAPTPAATPRPTVRPTPAPTPVPTPGPATATPVATQVPAAPTPPAASPSASATASDPPSRSQTPSAPAVSPSQAPVNPPEPDSPPIGDGPADAVPIALVGIAGAAVLVGIALAYRRGRGRGA